jgi:hypothetical protein
VIAIQKFFDDGEDIFGRYPDLTGLLFRTHVLYYNLIIYFFSVLFKKNAGGLELTIWQEKWRSSRERQRATISAKALRVSL